MAKKTSISPQDKVKIPTVIGDSTPDYSQTGFMAIDHPPSWIQKITSGFIPYIIFIVLGIALYANTFKHEYALDDDIVICKNEYVLQGFRGVPKIFKIDLFQSFYEQMNTVAQLSGGRYRPLAIATFAIEQEFLGTIPSDIPKTKAENPTLYAKYEKFDLDKNNEISANERVLSFLNSRADFNKNGKFDKEEDFNNDGLYNDKDAKVYGMSLRHINNVLLYILNVCIIFLFLSKFIFKENKLFAFLTAFLFLVHPIHTEVVGNVKSRDEILSLTFILLTLYNGFKFMETKNKYNLIWMGVNYFLALLCKEYAGAMVFIMPIAFYVYFNKKSIFDFTKPMLVIGAVLALYLLLREQLGLSLFTSSDLQDTELLNNPYLKAEDDQLTASKLLVNLKYFILLLFPYNLSCDYSYNVIPYATFTSPKVLLSLLLVGGGFFALARTFFKRNWLAFPIAFIMMHLILVNNMIFNVGATMGERMMYHSSLGFIIVLLWALYELFKKLKLDPIKMTAAAALLFGVYYAGTTFARNPAWKNDITLHLTDVQHMPESTMLNGNACTRLIELAEMPANKDISDRLLDSAKIYGIKSLKLHDRFVNSYLNMGIIYAKQGKVDSAAYYWNGVERFYPNHPQLLLIKQNLAASFLNSAVAKVNAKDFKGAVADLLKALEKVPNNPAVLGNLGGAYFNLGDYANAKKYWSMGMQVAPNEPSIVNGVKIMQQMGVW